MQAVLTVINSAAVSEFQLRHAICKRAGNTFSCLHVLEASRQEEQRQAFRENECMNERTNSGVISRRGRLESLFAVTFNVDLAPRCTRISIGAFSSTIRSAQVIPRTTSFPCLTYLTDQLRVYK